MSGLDRESTNPRRDTSREEGTLQKSGKRGRGYGEWMVEVMQKNADIEKKKELYEEILGGKYSDVKKSVHLWELLSTLLLVDQPISGK